MASDLVETHMHELCCNTCGDIGFETALFRCPKCKVGYEHVYCMSKFCMTAPMDVPADWCCEMCRSTSMASSDSGLKEVSSEAVTCSLSTMLPHDPKVLTDRQSFCRGARGNWHEKAVGKGKTKYLWTNEVLNMPSGEKKGEPARVGPISSKPTRSVASDHNTGLMKLKSVIHADSSYRVNINPKFGLSRNLKKLHPARSGNNTSVQKFKELKSNLIRVNYGTSSNEADFICQMFHQRITGVQLTNDVKPKNSDAGNIIFTVKEFYTKAAAEELLPTDPSMIASWRGSFILKDEKTSMGFHAHPTSQGLSKVKEFSKKMPEVLEFELCLYEDFLRTVFKGCDPDDKDIGLYFFPDHVMRPNTYISHLEQLSSNLFMRSCIDGVELLVFTSKVLHKDYPKRNKCDFLWGIYRRCHRKLKGAVEEAMVVDMAIDSEQVDMIGGEMVGPVDIVVPKQSIESDIDIPPGFSPSMRRFSPSMRRGQRRGQGKMKIKKEVL